MFYYSQCSVMHVEVLQCYTSHVNIFYSSHVIVLTCKYAATPTVRLA